MDGIIMRPPCPAPDRAPGQALVSGIHGRTANGLIMNVEGRDEPGHDTIGSVGPAPAFTDDQLAAGEHLFRQASTFLMSVVRVADLPPAGPTEIAFAGRSNVGKSTLLNALTNRKGLARASNTPGRTRELNFFDLGGRLTLVDMPGYGYAKAPKTQVAGWNRLILDYLRGRPSLRRVILLIDARHGLKPSDEATMSAMDGAAVSYQAVLTKGDKVKDRALAETLERTAGLLAKHPAAHPVLIATSSETGLGMPELRAALHALTQE